MFHLSELQWDRNVQSESGKARMLLGKKSGRKETRMRIGISLNVSYNSKEHRWVAITTPYIEVFQLHKWKFARMAFFITIWG